MDRLPENVLIRGFCFVNGKTRVDKIVTRNLIREWQSKVNKDGRAGSQFDDQWHEFARAVQKAANLLRREFNVYIDLCIKNAIIGAEACIYAQTEG
jgi:hypothetical protein